MTSLNHGFLFGFASMTEGLYARLTKTLEGPVAFVATGGFAPDVRALAVFALLGILHFAYKKKTQKAPSPIGMILLSAVLGAVLWSI